MAPLFLVLFPAKKEGGTSSEKEYGLRRGICCFFFVLSALSLGRGMGSTLLTLCLNMEILSSVLHSLLRFLSLGLQGREYHHHGTPDYGVCV